MLSNFTDNELREIYKACDNGSLDEVNKLLSDYPVQSIHDLVLEGDTLYENYPKYSMLMYSICNWSVSNNLDIYQHIVSFLSENEKASFVRHENYLALSMVINQMVYPYCAHETSLIKSLLSYISNEEARNAISYIKLDVAEKTFIEEKCPELIGLAEKNHENCSKNYTSNRDNEKNDIIFSTTASTQLQVLPTFEHHDKYVPQVIPSKSDCCDDVLNQSMVKYKLLAFIRLNELNSKLIDELEYGMCSALSRAFLLEPQGWLNKLKLIQTWDGIKGSLTEDLITLFKSLVDLTLNSGKEYKSYIGGCLNEFIEGANGNILLGNAWHNIALSANQEQLQYVLYDPNHPDGPLRVDIGQLEATIQGILGTQVFCSEAAKQSTPVLNDDFYIEGGFLSLLHMDSHLLATIDVGELSLEALSGLMVIGLKNIPAWLHSLFNSPNAMNFCIEALSHYASLEENIIDKCELSISGLRRDKQQAAREIYQTVLINKSIPAKALKVWHELHKDCCQLVKVGSETSILSKRVQQESSYRSQNVQMVSRYLVKQSIFKEKPIIEPQVDYHCINKLI